MNSAAPLWGDCLPPGCICCRPSRKHPPPALLHALTGHLTLLHSVCFDKENLSHWTPKYLGISNYNEHYFWHFKDFPHSTLGIHYTVLVCLQFSEQTCSVCIPDLWSQSEGPCPRDHQCWWSRTKGELHKPLHHASCGWLVCLSIAFGWHSLFSEWL